MKIMIAGRGFDDGKRHNLGIFELDQAKALRDAGHDVRFAAQDTRSIRHRRPSGFHMYECEGIHVFYESIPCGCLPFGLLALAGRFASEGLFRHVTKDGWWPDVIHQHFATDFGYIAKRNNIPFVFTEHFSGHNRVLPSKQRKKLREDYSRTDCCIAVSSALAENMRKNTGISAVVIPNIVETEIFSFHTSKKKTPFVFVSTGNLIPIKNFEMLIRAFSQTSSSSRLIIIGDGQLHDELQKIVLEKGLSDRVLFVGHKERCDIQKIYEECSCFILSSHSETFGVAGVEALAAGIPVIATRCGGPEDYINEKNGILIPNNDEKKLAEAMDYMITHIDNYHGESISNDVKEKYSPKVIGAQLEAVYKEVLSC